jgi:nitroreductase
VTAPPLDGAAAGLAWEIDRRRSCREGYVRDPIPDHVIESVVTAGRLAPSSKHNQPWRFHVVTRLAVLDHLADLVDRAQGSEGFAPIDPTTGQLRAWRSTVRESAAVLRSVPVGVFVENRGPHSGGRAVLAAARRELLPHALRGYLFEALGLGAAIQNLWLQACASGLSAVFMGDVVVAEDEIRRALDMPGDLVGVLALGRGGVGGPPRDLAPDRVVWHSSEAGGGARA